ncbi:MAG TPA: bifunctional 2-C-methyl-D-erythritol 4-phosphate cytidylyltransferase/2-C-methyl-D-erythritol 2,4-cyclodiphosphate synthase [Desulfobulbaceae bacterium]|nr:bifunctional 2-C-methyl-D-erythritol 4-phosphate cytidylyltransferase/2-C-methyl-D-erythritol 2,4-cyclodiphosphate synthase [Desulfobulbaceae bacterium]
MSGQDLTEAAAIIAAAGSGTRMGGDVPKQFITLRGTPILALTVAHFLQVDALRTVLVVVPAEHREAAALLLRDFLPAGSEDRILLVNGGATRQESVRAGLQALPLRTATVLVHDGARPFVTSAIIERCLRATEQNGAAIAAVRVRDTLKQASADQLVRITIDRRGLWQAQTPQGARVELLRQAYALADQDGFQGTDEASLMEHAGIPVAIVEGSERNFKITRPDDLALAAGLTQETQMLKIGHGFDAHRLVRGRPLILGGVHIPFELGLDGHSDADTLIHAFLDALLGAMGEGDIGRHFPDSDQRYKNISSLNLLADVVGLLQEKNLGLSNADITVICQRPKLAPYIGAMRENLARACAVSAAALNIKATTTEQMGFTGRGEGIAAHAVVLLHHLPA